MADPSEPGPWSARLITAIPFGDFDTHAVPVGALPGEPPAELVDPVDGRGNSYPGRWALLGLDHAERTATYSTAR